MNPYEPPSVTANNRPRFWQVIYSVGVIMTLAVIISLVLFPIPGKPVIYERDTLEREVTFPAQR